MNMKNGFLRLFATLGLALSALAVQAQPGLVKAVFTGSAYDGTSSIWDDPNATVVEDLAEIYPVRSDMPTTTTWAYGTYMQFEGGVDYLFHTYFNDHATVKIDNVDLLPEGSESANRYAAIRFPETGWHRVEFRFANNIGVGGCVLSSYCGALIKKGAGDWKQLLAANEQFETTAPAGAGLVAPSYAYVFTLDGTAAFISQTVVAAATRPATFGPYRVFASTNAKITFTDTSATDIVFGEDVYVVINDNAFANNSNIRTIDIKYGSIGWGAFWECRNLTSVHLGGAVVAVNAFKGCVALTDLQLDGGTLGDSAFSGCTGLTTISLTGDVGASTFSGCTSLESVVLNGSVERYAFKDCSHLATATINGAIGESAFSGCTALTTLEVGGSVGGYACQNLTSLKTLTLGRGIERINQFAFLGCSGLTGTLVIPDTVTYIGRAAFLGCTGLTGDLVIPASVQKIESAPYSYVGDPYGAFRGCTGFNGRLIIEDGVGEIYDGVFEGCSGFKGDLVLPPTVRLMHYSDSLPKGAFYGCSGFDGRLTILCSGEIPGGTFYGCSGFTGNLEIPSTITTIGEKAFSGCRGFSSTLTLPEGVKYLGEDCFYDCPWLRKIVLPSTLETVYNAFRNEVGISEVVLAEGSKIVGGFQGCTGLTQIEVPDSVETVDRYAFAECTQLVNFNRPASLKLVRERAFYNCRKLLKLDWPAGATMEAYAFGNCTSWKGTFVIPEGVTVIPDGLFFGCEGLVEISVPDSVRQIGKEAFQGCSSLAAMTLPEGIEELADNLFYGCKALRSFTIPSSVRVLGSGVFSGGPVFSELVVPEGVTTIRGDLFSYPGRCGTIHLPGSLTSADKDILVRIDNVVFSGDLPVGYELWYGVKNHNISITRPSGETGLKVWPVTQFMGYTQEAKPTVKVLSSKIRENDPEVLDVVYKVTSTKPTVKVRALAFEDGERTFAKVVRPADFIADLDGNETKGNVGDGVTANEEHTLSWKVSSDWATRLAKVTFEVLAVEDDILPLELMTIPGTAEHPETWQVSWNYVTTDKTFEALLWLYADRDLGLTLKDGVLKNGDTRLVSGTTVSAYDALVYVYGKMGFNLLEGDNLQYVRDATRFNFPDKSSRQYAYKVVTPAGASVAE